MIEVLLEIALEVIGELLTETLTPFFSKVRLPKWVKIALLVLLSAAVLGAIIFAFIYAWQEIGLAGFLACLGCMALPFLIWLIVVLSLRMRYGILRPAKKEALPEVLSMYRSVIGKPGCNWSISYPNEITLQEDFRSGNLYVLSKGRKIIGAGSIVPKNELDDLLCWHFRENAREIARIVIKPEFQSKGYGKHLARRICVQLRKSGVKAVHLLVSTENAHAIRLYRNIGFYGRTQCKRYGHTYYAFEKKL